MRSHVVPVAMPDMRIGLLGGSFNPAHAGHLALSIEAIKRFELDQVWWLVSPQNPLKPAVASVPSQQRAALARSVAAHPGIVVTCLENALGTRFTIDSVTRITTRWPGTRFVWLMGADILPELSAWKRWRELMSRIPVAVFDRPGYTLDAFSSSPAIAYNQARWDMGDASGLLYARPPAWCFVFAGRNSLSSSELRKTAARRPQAP